jgi:hypothetical protein
VNIHQTVSATGDILNVDVAQLAQDTRTAMLKWFADLQHDPARLAAVTSNLRKLAHYKPKVAELPTTDASGSILTVTYLGMTTSST